MKKDYERYVVVGRTFEKQFFNNYKDALNCVNSSQCRYDKEIAIGGIKDNKVVEWEDFYTDYEDYED